MVEHCCGAVTFENNNCTLLMAVPMSLGGISIPAHADYPVWVIKHVWQKIKGKLTMIISF